MLTKNNCECNHADVLLNFFIDSDRDYLRNFIPELNPYGGPIFPYLSALVDSKSGKKIDFYVNDYEDFNKEKYENELVRSTETGQQQQSMSVHLPNVPAFDIEMETSSYVQMNENKTTQRARDSLERDRQSNEKFEPLKRKVKPKLNTIFEGELLDDAEAYLLNLIFERAILFDYTLPIAERNPLSLSRAWSEVHEKMKLWIREKSNDDTKITLDVLKDTWMTIRTAYMRHKSIKKLPSGSSPSKKPVADIKHFAILSQYDSVSERRRTISTTEGSDYDGDYAEERLKECKAPKKRGKLNDEFLNVAKKVLTSVSNRMETSSKEIAITKDIAATKEMSSSRHFVESLIVDLNSLKGRHLASAKMRISQVIYDEMTQQCDEA